MPYKDKEKRKIAVKKSMRKIRGVDMPEDVSSESNINQDDITELFEPIADEKIKFVTLDILMKFIKPMQKSLDKMGSDLLELRNKVEEKIDTSVDWGRVRKTERENTVATESGLCPKHGRIKIPGRPSCC